MDSPGISLCMISRNEADCIGKAIKSAAGVVDDIIVVDTGSTDGTIEAAKAAGARVFSQPWEDSFSKPRNFGFDQVKTPWVFILDCDEVLQESSAAKLVEFCRTTTAHAGMVFLKYHTQGGTSPMRRVRVIRADKGYRAQFRIHERPIPKFESIAETHVVIEHFGHLDRSGDAKAELYGRLQDLDLADRPNDNYLIIDIMHSMQKRGDAKWKQYLPRAISTLDRNAEKPPHALVEVLLELILRLPYQEQPVEMRQEQAAVLAEKWLARSIPLLLARAEWNLRNQRFAQAKKLSERALRFWKNKTFQPCVPFNPEAATTQLESVLKMANEGIAQHSR